MSYFADAASDAQQAPPTHDECNAAFWAHLASALASLFTAGILLPLIAPMLALFLTQSRRPFVLFHINQAAFFQLAIHVLQVVLGVVITVIAFVTCGIGMVLYALMAIPWLMSIVIPLIHAFAAKRGEWSRMPWVGDRVLAMDRPFFS